MIFRSLVALALLVAGSAPALGQTLDVRTLALFPGEMPEVHLQPAEEGRAPELLQWPEREPSPAVKVAAAATLALLTREQGEEGEVTYKIADKIEVPAGAGGVLLLGWRDGEKARFVAIKDDLVGARFSDWLLINATGKPVAFRAGKGGRTMVVKPGASESYRVGVDAGKGAEVLAQVPEDGEAKTIYSTYWPVRPDSRALVLFVDNGRKIRVKRISDRLLPADDGEE